MRTVAQKSRSQIFAPLRCLFVTLMFLACNCAAGAQQPTAPALSILEDSAEIPQGRPDVPKPKPPSQESKISPSGKLPAILAPQMTEHRLDPGDKFRLYAHQAIDPLGFLAVAFGAGLTMASPPDHYPGEWKNGAGAFGLLLGDAVARRESAQAAQFLAQVTFREDPRYLPSSRHSILGRIAHAVAFAIVDRSDSGHSRPAFSNYLGAAASGFIGNAYLPEGYNDLVHAGQRTAYSFGDFALSNVANEFCPEWGPIVNRMHLPLVHPPCEERMRTKQNNTAKFSNKNKK